MQSVSNSSYMLLSNPSHWALRLIATVLNWGTHTFLWCKGLLRLVQIKQLLMIGWSVNKIIKEFPALVKLITSIFFFKRLFKFNIFELSLFFLSQNLLKVFIQVFKFGVGTFVMDPLRVFFLAFHFHYFIHQYIVLFALKFFNDVVESFKFRLVLNVIRHIMPNSVCSILGFFCLFCIIFTKFEIQRVFKSKIWVCMVDEWVFYRFQELLRHCIFIRSVSLCIWLMLCLISINVFTFIYLDLTEVR